MSATNEKMLDEGGKSIVALMVALLVAIFAFQLNASMLSPALTPYALLGLAFGPVAGILASKFGYHAVLRGGLIVSVLGVLFGISFAILYAAMDAVAATAGAAAGYAASMVAGAILLGLALLASFLIPKEADADNS